MSNIVTDKIIPDSGSSNTLTVGGTGDSVVVLDSLNVNSLQDAGGNNIFVSNGSGTITSKNSGLAGGMNLISTQTASGSTSLSFTSGLDSTYDVYVFKFIDIDAVTLNAALQFQGSTDGGSNYNTTMTTTWFYSWNNEAGDSGGLAYVPAQDQSQGTAYQNIATSFGSDADQSCVGELHLFAPSSTTYVKHFYLTTSQYSKAPEQATYCVAGYFNTTSALDALSFKMDTGNFSGVIKMYGISKS